MGLRRGVAERGRAGHGVVRSTVWDATGAHTGDGRPGRGPRGRHGEAGTGEGRGRGRGRGGRGVFVRAWSQMVTGSVTVVVVLVVPCPPRPPSTVARVLLRPPLRPRICCPSPSASNPPAAPPRLSPTLSSPSASTMASNAPINGIKVSCASPRSSFCPRLASPRLAPAFSFPAPAFGPRPSCPFLRPLLLFLSTSVFAFFSYRCHQTLTLFFLASHRRPT